MKKFRKVLYTVLTIVAAAIYFAEELGEIFSQVEKEKQEVAQIVSKWQEETGVKVKDAADASKKAVKEVAAKAEKVAGKQKDEAGEKEASGNTARKSTGSAAGKQNAPARLEIPRMQKDAPSQILEYTGHTLSYNSKTRLHTSLPAGRPRETIPARTSLPGTLRPTARREIRRITAIRGGTAATWLLQVT